MNKGLILFVIVIALVMFVLIFFWGPAPGSPIKGEKTHYSRWNWGNRVGIKYFLQREPKC